MKRKERNKLPDLELNDSEARGTDMTKVKIKLSPKVRIILLKSHQYQHPSLSGLHYVSFATLNTLHSVTPPTPSSFNPHYFPSRIGSSKSNFSIPHRSGFSVFYPLRLKLRGLN